MKSLKKIWLSFSAPFKVILFHHKHDFCIWLIYVIFASLLGVVINVVQHCAFEGKNFQEALALDSQSGSFYTFSLVICASLIWPIFKSLTSKEQPEYSLIRTILLSILIFANLFCSIFYAFSNVNTHKWFYQVSNNFYPIDIPQLLFFILAILLSIYSFGLSYLNKHPDEYPVTDEHLRNENKEVNDIKTSLEDGGTKNAQITNPETQTSFKY